MHNLAIVIPAHNEEKRIGNTLREYIPYFTNQIKLGKIKSFKIIVVVNACSDNTLGVVNPYAGKFLEILNFVKGGKGFAVIEGFKHAIKNNYSIVGFVDADMSTRPDEFNRIIHSLGDADGVIASRYLPGARLSPPNTLIRMTASRVYNFFIRAMLFIPFRDTQCGAKIFRREALIRIVPLIGMTQWAFDIELLYLLHVYRFKIKETATVWSNKDYSKIDFWKSGPWMALAIVRLRMLHSPFKKMVRLYDKFIHFFKPTNK